MPPLSGNKTARVATQTVMPGLLLSNCYQTGICPGRYSSGGERKPSVSKLAMQYHTGENVFREKKGTLKWQ